ncbi:probable alpha amylase [Crocosphaera subtropica ATCC 51142]|uniref:Alpha-amylase n=2 Tax=Crocosphaera TaxID=263510 RepID=B1X0C1_CROS5|nr:probable alpha amylase [Crocosphaera subtropica ATCC 51142]
MRDRSVGMFVKEENVMRDVVLHVFNWQYQEIINRLGEIRDAGYGALLIPPPIYSDVKGHDWWQCYQPKDYRVVLSHLGGKQELKELIEQCHTIEPKLKVYADIIINHMANETRPDRLNFPGEAELANYRKNQALFEANRLYGDLSVGLFSPFDFNRGGNIERDQWCDRDRVIYGDYNNLPDLMDSPWVLSQQRTMLIALAAMGFDGFRIDAIKHLSERMIDNFADSESLAGSYFFGEVLTGSDCEENIFLDPFLRETWISAYDFPLFQTIREAFGFGGSLRKLAHPEAENNALPWDRAVTFVVNHDIPHNKDFRGWLLDPTDEHLAYVYILGRDGGLPLIYSDHNESAHTYSKDRDRWFDAFQREDIKAMIKFHNAVHGNPMTILYDSDLLLVFRRGENGIVAINKAGYDTSVEFNTWGLKSSSYEDLISHRQMRLGGDRCTLSMNPRTAQMWLCHQ